MIFSLVRLSMSCFLSLTLIISGCQKESKSGLDSSHDSIATQDTQDEFRLNELHFLGSHNSYHNQKGFALVPSYQYQHPPIDEQLSSYGIRALELDVHRPRNDRPLEVYHVASLDSTTSCTTLKICLEILRNWSDNNPDHIPIFVWIELKQGAAGGLPFDRKEHFELVDTVIRDSLGTDKIISPDDITDSGQTLRESIRSSGWPSLKKARGKFLFMLDFHPNTKKLYLDEKAGLAGRIMFPRASKDDLMSPWAVVAKTDPGPFHDSAIENNFLVSANICSANLASEVCKERLTNAIEAGTQLLMDDILAPMFVRESNTNALFSSDESYSLRLPGGRIWMCNKVTRGECGDVDDVL